MPDAPAERASFADFVGRAARSAPEPPNTMPAVDDPVSAALAGLAAIYEAGNRQAAKVPGASRLASLGKRGSEELHAWAAAPASRDVQKSRETFAKLFDFVVPQDELGALLAATPVGRPARQTRSARNYRYFHGTSPERAERILAGEGFQSGRSALLGVEGTSLSRDPNVSLSRFGRGKQEGLLVVDVPEHLQQQTRHMSPGDFYNTKEILESRNAPVIYNKPSTIYKELETFVRRAHPEEPGGQLGLFRASDEIRARRPTPEELRYATTVEARVGNAFRLQTSMNERSLAAFGMRNKLAAAQDGFYVPDDAYDVLTRRGLPTPHEVITSFRQYVGAGSGTERAKAGMFLNKTLRGTQMYVYGGTKNPTLGMTPDFLYPGTRAPSTQFAIDLVGGKPVAKWIGQDSPSTNFADFKKRLGQWWSPSTNFADFEKRLDQWWSTRSKNTKDSFRQWDTPRGKKLLYTSVTESAHITMRDARDNIQAAVWLQRARAKGLGSNEVELELLKYGKKGEPRSAKLLIPGDIGRGLSASTVGARQISESDFKTLVRIDDTRVSVDADELRDVLVRRGHEQMKQGVKKREKFIRDIEELSH